MEAGVFDDSTKSNIQNSKKDDTGKLGRRYCDPPNMTTFAAYYETSEESTDYDFLQDQNAMIDYNVSTSDKEKLEENILIDVGIVISFFPTYYISSTYGPFKPFGYCLLFLLVLVFRAQITNIINHVLLGLLSGSILYLFYDMVFHFISNNRILTSFAAVKYVGVAIAECVMLYNVTAEKYKFYASCFLVILWFIIWSKIQIRLSELQYSRRRVLKVRTPWRDILSSRTIWMTTLAIFAAGCGNACINTGMRLYLQNVYHLQVGILSALSKLIHFAFAILCCYCVNILIRSETVSVTSARRMAVYVSHFLPAGVLFVLGFVGCGLLTPMILYCLAVMLTGANYVGIFSSPLDLAPSHSGPVLAFCFTFLALGELFGHYIIYYILKNQALVSWRFIFSLNSLILLVTAIFFMLRGSGSPQPWNDPEHKVAKENKNVTERTVSVSVPESKPRTKSIYMVEKKILKVLHVQEPDKFTRVRAYSTSLPNERCTANQPNIYRPSNKKRASIS